MAISKNTQDLENTKFKESTTTSGQPGVVVLNPDGSNVGGGSSADQTTFTSGTTTDQIVAGVYQSSPDTIASGKSAAIAIDEKRRVIVTLGTSLLNTTDSVTAYQSTDSIMNGTSALTPATAFANVAASQTDSSLVAAVTAKKIRVLAVYAQTGGTATTLVFNSKPVGAGTAISPTMQNGANSGEILPFNPVGWFDTNSGEGLTVTTGTGSTTGILVKYIQF